ncbi:M20/M25/M40 family metallo-hydrolase [Spartinivicinus poritis]|uniref:M20/M25/M40 family metallo-hydrolase n=1 Tax=Spartinivicinus poritis TaxID=2994640 RepID=A0ABT5U7A2_9GAMM|nr:M20/M25/M40 family metallo-hydrolase [Spartinivicinus sp. A2-2]MDE1461039.1 M20/M25/M40 family metallo-hydrolase [Spartinivicinus sp. A2-2]
MIKLRTVVLASSVIATCFAQITLAQESNIEHKWITLGKDAALKIEQLVPGLLSERKVIKQPVISNEVSDNDSISPDKQKTIVVRSINSKRIELLSVYMHRLFNRCGGFMVHSSYQSAQKFLNQTHHYLTRAKHRAASDIAEAVYSINQRQLVAQLLPQITESKIRRTIAKLSAYQNRYYLSETGVHAAKFIKRQWAHLARNRDDVQVNLFNHDSYPQSSVIMTIPGKTKPDEIIVVGGHLDSINGGDPRLTALAPGADDNASGIATITEIIRVLLKNDFYPERTIQFMGYAAEEIGLLGSSDIAAQYREANKKIVGVVQFDMTNYQGSANDIVLMEDYTDPTQNQFLARLARTYLPEMQIGYSKCGYGCSDHASWTANGYPASFPFEATMDKLNQKIHSTEDTIDQSGGHALHALKFAKLGIAYVVEVAIPFSNDF